ncbi:MAG: TRAP transporter substrate-binding protein [Cytophagales bacterium]|nr:TRAP transporter substrate-binding protein [Bernardetiaceae bacterium]MDW8204694.1 TRAP transporter substrate-binding protein [Cytophagales bacterium]
MKISTIKKQIHPFFLLCAFMAACTPQEHKRTLIIAHGLNTSHPVHKALEVFAQQIEQKSAGNMHARIYPAQQLGTERETLELLQLGAISATKVSSAVLENFSPTFAVFSVPYLFHPSDNLYEALHQPACKEVLQTLESAAMVGLCYFSAGFRHVYTRNRPVITPQDLKGLKIRVMESNSSIRLFQQLGAAPTPISWGELYTALQQNVVEAAENNPPSYLYSRHFEVCPHYFLTYHLCLPDVLVFSKRVWDQLQPEEQLIIKEAAAEAAKFQFAFWNQTEQAILEELRGKNVQIKSIDIQPFISQTKGFAEEHLSGEALIFYEKINQYRHESP